MALDRSEWYFPGPALVCDRLAVNRAAYREPMAAGYCDRPEGTGDVLVMLFHDPASIDIDDHPAYALRCWPHGAGHFYGGREREWWHSWIHMRGPLADAMAEALPAVVHLVEPEPVTRHLRQLIRSLVIDRDAELAVYGLQALLRAVQAQDGLRERVPVAWQELRRWLEMHAADEQSLTDLAARMGLAKSQFSARFVAYFGVSPLRFVQDLRLDRARWLLRDRNYTIGDVAREVGYQDVAYFSRLVRQRFGRPPGQLRDS